MFELDKGDSYDWIVSLAEPNNRTHKVETFTASFKRLSQPRIDELNEQIRLRMVAATAGEETTGMIDDVDLADEVLVGWSGITQGGEAYEFTEARKQDLIKRSQFAAAVVMAWNESIIGGRKKTLKTQQGIA